MQSKPALLTSALLLQGNGAGVCPLLCISFFCPRNLWAGKCATEHKKHKKSLQEIKSGHFFISCFYFSRKICRVLPANSIELRWLVALLCPTELMKCTFLDFLREDTSVGTSFLRVAAHDDDYGSNASITYSAAGGKTKYFQVNPSTGWVYVNQPLLQVRCELPLVCGQMSAGGICRW